MKTLFSNIYVRYSLFGIGGLLIGWILFHPSQKNETKQVITEQAQKTVWTCSMHPQIRKDEAGKCPICSMDLIPLVQNNSAVDSDAVYLTAESAALANVQTSVVTKEKATKEIRLYGKIQADERLLQNQVSHISGRVEKLLVNFTGEVVKKGQPLALIYSPEMVTAEQDLLEASKTKQIEPEIYAAAKEKLRQWKLSESQISRIEKSGKVQTDFQVISNTSGIVSARRVNTGDYINQGTVLYDIADLSNLWVMFDAYENDLSFLEIGNTISFTVQAIPGTNFAGKISFIDPVIDPTNRVAKVRVEITNKQGLLKPEMFATGVAIADLSKYKNSIIIPRSAVLWTGKRSLVYIKENPTEQVFKVREIEIGPMLGNSYVVLSGLQEGEEIVTQGTFSIDAAAQLDGKPSMMNSEKIKTLNEQNHQNQPKTQTQISEKSNQPIIHSSFKVYGECEMCKVRIENAVLSINGVSSPIWDMKTKMLSLNFNPNQTSLEAIYSSLAKVGHDTEKQKADKKTYDVLPDCCKYR
jgi:Cu(I)/Ag(I) efflux system membrane fusion protein